MAKQKKPNQNILIEYTSWIFKWIFKIILFLAILGALVYGGNYLKKEYDKSQRLKARDCLAKEIPIYEKGIKDFSDSIKPSSSLKEIVDMVFYEDTFISSHGNAVGYKHKKAYLNSLVTDNEKDQKKLLALYELYEKTRYVALQVTDSNIKKNVLVYLLKPKCDSNFDFLINITDNEDRSLDTFRVWAQNSPLGYKDGYKHTFYRDFKSEITQKFIDERARKNKIIQKKKRKEKEKIDAKLRKQRDKEEAQKVREKKFHRAQKEREKELKIRDEQRRKAQDLIYSAPKKKGGYVPEKGPVHQF